MDVVYTSAREKERESKGERERDLVNSRGQRE